MSIHFTQGTEDDIKLNLHGVAGIKHCINEQRRLMTFIFYVSFSDDEQNITQHTKKNLECVPLRSNHSTDMMTGDQVLIKWLSISEGDESYSEAIKEDACNWIKKATSESNINIYKLLLWYSKILLIQSLRKSHRKCQ